MYKLIITTGTELGYSEKVRYIKVSDGGTFVECDQAEAVGVAYKGTAYNLLGHADIDGAETVQVSEVALEDVISSLEEKMQADIDYIAMMSDVDLSEEVAE